MKHLDHDFREGISGERVTEIIYHHLPFKEWAVRLVDIIVNKGVTHVFEGKNL